MSQKLLLVFCTSYQKEVEEIFRSQAWDSVDHLFLPEVCRYPQLKKQAEKELATLQENPETQIHIVGCYINCIGCQNDHQATKFSDFEQCLHLIIPPAEVTHYFNQGIYLLPPSWLSNWEEHLSRWGLDQQTAREMFHESSNKLLLIDTLVSADSPKQLAKLGQYLDLPTDRMPIGLDFMKMILSAIIMEWQHKSALTQIKKMMRESNQISADYAMAMDLLMNLTQIHNESDAIAEIVDLFTMLFSADRVIYLPVKEGMLIQRGDHSLQLEEFEAIQTWSRELDSPILEAKFGFSLKMQYYHEMIGVLIIEDLKLPEYKQRYMNLAVSIAQLCGLAISNARMYHQLATTEQKALYERGVSETFRKLLSDLVSQQDLDDVLNQTLISLTKLVPIHSAIIYLKHKDQYQYRSGIQIDNKKRITQYDPPMDQRTLPISEYLTPIDISLVDLAPISNSHPLSPSFQSEWKLFPLSIRGKQLGFLAITTNIPIVLNEQRDLIQMFANEVTIAIENARLFEEIKDMAIKDGLTDIYNRRHFYDLAKIEFARAKRYRTPLSILMLDIDHFKAVNDQYGHPFGDLVLKQVAKLCLDSIREMDIFGRYGGEEFVFALPGADQSEAEIIAERIRATISDFNFHDKTFQINITVSIGIGSLDESMNSFEDLLQSSDKVLYLAKQSGRNCVATNFTTP
jgi:diguanylate cyclase (GGDEF)-like protein